jgi:hypothetical protein
VGNKKNHHRNTAHEDYSQITASQRLASEGGSCSPPPTTTTTGDIYTPGMILYTNMSMTRMPMAMRKHISRQHVLRLAAF